MKDPKLLKKSGDSDKDEEEDEEGANSLISNGPSDNS